MLYKYKFFTTVKFVQTSSLPEYLQCIICCFIHSIKFQENIQQDLISYRRGLETTTKLIARQTFVKINFTCDAFFRIVFFLGQNMDLNQRIQYKCNPVTSLSLIPFCILQIMCCIRGVYGKLFVSKFIFIASQIRTKMLILSLLDM